MRFDTSSPDRLVASTSRYAIATGATMLGAVTAGYGVVALANGGWHHPLWIVFGGAALLLAFSAFEFGRRLEIEVRADGVRMRNLGRWLTRRHFLPADQIERVRVEVERAGGEVQAAHGYAPRRVFYHLSIDAQPSPGLPLQSIGLLRSRDEAPVQRIACAIARHLEIPLQDAVGDVAVALQPPALTEPVRATEPTPTPRRVRLCETGEGPALRMSGLAPRRRAVGYTAGFALSLVLTASIGAMIVANFPRDWTTGLLILLGAVQLVVAGRCAYVVCGREAIAAIGDRLLYARSLFGVPVVRRAVPIDAVRRLRVQTRTVDARGLAIVAETEVIVAGAALRLDELAWLSAKLGEWCAHSREPEPEVDVAEPMLV